MTKIVYREAILIKDAAKFSRMYIDYITELSEYSSRLSQLSTTEIKRDAIGYFEDGYYIPFIIEQNTETIGFFVIGKKENKHPDADNFLAEYYIIPKFRRQGIGKDIAKRILKQYGTKWSLFVLAENVQAYSFWESVINEIGSFIELKDVGATPDDCIQIGIVVNKI